MFTLIIAIHVLACILLIFIVLIQQGRGGGLIDSLSSADSIFGTKTNAFLVKSTSVFAVIFFFTCLSLAFLSIQKSKSLIETSYRPPVETALPARTTAAAPAATVPAATAPTTSAAKQETAPVATTQGQTAASTQATAAAKPQAPQTSSKP